jgi:branched-chain amino acid transport system ATP-binding protein
MLQIDALTVRFDGLEALAGIDLALADGEVLGLVGPNGSGKSTLFNAITGLCAPDSGRVRFGGIEIAGKPAHLIARLGIARSFQHPRLFQRMTVFDNVWAAQHSLPGIGWRGLTALGGMAERTRRAAVDRLLREAGLAERRGALAGELPLADQRRLELARALAREPKLLLLDEPAGGMTPAETAELVDLLRRIALPGRACIVIEHKIDLIAALCDRVAVLDFGRKIAEGRPAAVLADSAVRAAYFGADGTGDARSR